MSAGEYWVGIHTPFNAAASNKAYSTKSNYFLEVPEGVPLLYAGGPFRFLHKSLGLVRALDRPLRRCPDRGRARSRRNRFASRFWRSLADGNRTAASVDAGAWSRKSGESGADERYPERAASPFDTRLEKKGVGRATGLGTTITGETVADIGGGDRSFGAGLILGYLLYLPFGTAGGLIGGEHSDQKWSPCMNTIASEVVNWSPPDALRAVMVEALARRGVDNITLEDNVSSMFREGGQPRVRTLFEIEIQEIVFRECGKRWTFCGEMKVRGRIRDLAKGRVLYNGILVYSNGSGGSPFSKQPDRMPYKRFANMDAACRSIEEYCAPEGAKLFVQDLEAAARFLVERLVGEAGVSPGRDGERQISMSSGSFLFPKVMYSPDPTVKDRH